MPTFRTWRAKRSGIESMASSTSSRKRSRRHCLRAPCLRDLLRRALDSRVSRPWRARPGFDRLGHEASAIEIAVRPDVAARAERLRPADAAAVQDQHVRGARPPLGRQHRAQLRLDLDRIVALAPGRADWRRAARGDRPAGRGRRARARARRWRSCGRRRAASSAPPCRPAPVRHAPRRASSPCRSATSTSAGRSPSRESASRARGVLAAASARASG